MKYKLTTTSSQVFIRRAQFTNPEYFQHLYCPFAPQSVQCGEWCPHFDVEDFLGKARVSITCTPTRRLIAIDSEEGLSLGS